MYRSIISLGAWCQVAEQFRRHNFPRTLSPFEWTVSTWSAMSDVIREDGHRLCQDLTLNAEGTAFVCQAYGLLHPHDFERAAGGSGAVLPPTPEKFEANRAKYAHKMNDFRQACRSTEGRIAFVRMGGEAEPAAAWPYLHDLKPLTTHRVNELVALLIAYCGHDNFDLFVMLHDGWHPFAHTASLASNARIVALPHPQPPVDWYGHKHDWSQVYADAGIRMIDEARQPKFGLAS
jgi:hypothetical protein